MTDSNLPLAEVLAPERIVKLAELAGHLGMTTLIEAHDADLLQRMVECVPSIHGPVLLGINNRDLATQTVDIGTTVRLAPQVKGVAPVVSESGIQTREDVLRVQRAGTAAVLVGESILRAPDIALHIRGLLDTA